MEEWSELSVSHWKQLVDNYADVLMEGVIVYEARVVLILPRDNFTS